MGKEFMHLRKIVIMGVRAVRYIVLCLINFYYMILPFRSAVSAQEHCSMPTNIIVSFTSYPKRFKIIPRTFKSIAYQSLKPDKVILYLAKEECAERLPEQLLRLQKYGLDIVLVDDNLKSHKKYYYSMKDYPNDIIITIDDDILYSRNLIKKLYKSYEKYPSSISAARVHRMKIENGKLCKYNDWDYQYRYSKKPSHWLFATSGGGTLFPPYLLPELLFNSTYIKKLCYSADDVWLKFMELKNDVKVVYVPGANRFIWNNGRLNREGLCMLNVIKNQNDIYIGVLSDFLDISIEEILEREMPECGGKIMLINKMKRYVLGKGWWKDSKDYWEKRYKFGGDSGAGSYSRLAQFKADILNDFVKKNNIISVIEWGCGDGNQLEYASYPEYIGIDVSPTAIQMCKEKFKRDISKEFYCSTTDDLPINKLFIEKADLALSLDVIYHLLEDDIYIKYIENLFASSKTYVCIYSCDFEMQFAKHVRCRKFTEYIERNIADWKLIKKIDNLFPYDVEDEANTSWSDFYFYKKVN